MRQMSYALKAGYWLSAVLWLSGFICLAVYQYMLWQVQVGESGHTNPDMWAIQGLAKLLLLGGGIVSLYILMNYMRERCLVASAIIENMGTLISGQTQLQAVITSIDENILLSDDVKSIAFREKDRQVLESAIQQDMRMEKWHSAEWLINRMEQRFGNKEDGDRLRKELLKARQGTFQEKIGEAIEAIRELHMIHHYQEAQQREEELISMYPGHEQVKAIQGRTETLRQEHKKELLKKLNNASQSNDVDQSVDILKLLDSYLTPTEAEALKESARDVFRARLHNLGIQFSLYVTDRAWDKALRTGDEIIQEYPNSRMAQEVREKMEILKRKIH